MNILSSQPDQKFCYQIFPHCLFIILMNTNGQQLNSEAIARYLTIIAANQRKLEYCREILSSNPTFVPLSYFQQAETGTKGQINRQSFRKMLENHNEGYKGQQADLIYSYFCIDEKSYVTFDQFYAAIIPKNNPSISKIIEKRQKDSYSLDYSLRFALCKFYAQVYETQYELQMKRMFSINIDSTNYRTKDGLRLSLDDLEQYLTDHSKFPTKAILKLLHAQINVNKGRGKRNLSIRVYIKKYLQRKRLQKGQLPPIQITIPQQEQKESANLRPIKQFTNPTFCSPEKKLITSPQKKSKAKENAVIGQSKLCITPSVSLISVEKRIHSLLSIVEIKPSTPVIRWGNYSAKKLSQITPNEQKEEIQNRVLKNKELNTKQKQQFQAQIPISESLKYSSIKISQSEKKHQNFQENQQGYENCLTDRENSFTERQRLRKRFRLTQQSIYTPCRRLEDSSTPTVNKNIQVSKPHEIKEAKEVKSVKKTPLRKVFNYSQEKGVSGDSTSRYKKYSYLNDSRNSLANRISYLKQLVSSPTKGTEQHFLLSK